MKRIVSLILVLCLVCAVVAEALADPNWEITQQTKLTMKEKKGKATSITISVKAKGKGIKYQWVFVDPENPERTSTGKKVAKAIKELKGLVVKNPTTNKITLTKIPDALHGWKIYCHLYSNAYKMDTEPVVIALPGMDAPEQPEVSASEDKNEKEDAKEAEEETESKSSSKSTDKTTSKDSGKSSSKDKKTTEKEAAAEQPQEFNVTVNGKYLYKTDSKGEPEGDEGVSSLTFTGKGSIAVKSKEPFKSWTVNGMRFEPDEEVSSFKMGNLTASTSISVKVAAKTVASAKVDDSVSLSVTCTGCTFSYLPKGLKRVTEGSVPSGAVIYVMADTTDAAANGYKINGAEAQNLGDSSIQVTVTKDTEIVVDPPAKKKK